MRPHIAALALVLTLTQSHLSLQASPSVTDERTQAAFLLGLGRPASQEDLRAEPAAKDAGLAAEVERLRQRLENDADARETVARKAWRDVHGRDAKTGEISPPSGPARIYVELVQDYLRGLAERRADYQAVLDRAYHQILQRKPHDIEYAYWEKRDVVPYMVVVACIEHWAQRNLPGLMSTTGEPTISIHSRQLWTVRVSPPVAAEARAIVGLGAADSWTTARERHVIAPGASEIVAVGGIHFVIAGR